MYLSTLQKWIREGLSLLLLLATAFLLVQAVYHMPRTVTFTATTPANILPRTGFSIQEQFADRPGYFRWTTGVAQLQLPNPGGSANIYMRLAGGPGRSIPVQLYSGGLTQTFLVAPDPRIYTFLLPPAPREQLLLRIASPTVHDDRDDRALGVVVGDIVLVGRGKAPAWIWLTLISATVGAYGLLRLLWRCITMAVIGVVSGQLLIVQGYWGWKYAVFTPTLFITLITITGIGMLYFGSFFIYRGVIRGILLVQRLRILSRKVIEIEWFIYAIIILFTAVLGGRFFVLIDRYAVNILFWDQWAFYTPLFDNSNLWSVFNRQHGPHRQGIGFVVTKFLANLTGWNSRIESFGVGVILCIAMLLALCLKQRLFRAITYTDITIPLIFLVTTQYEVVTGAINFSHGAFPVLIIMLYCLSWMHHNRIIRYTLVAVFNFLLIFTGFGIFMGAITPFLLMVDGYYTLVNRKTAFSVVPFLALITSFASVYIFLRGYIFATAIDCFVFPHEKIWEYPWFMSLMFSSLGGFAFEKTSLLASLLGVILLFFFCSILIYHGWQILRKKTVYKNVSLVIVILIGYVVLYVFNTAIGRVCLGLTTAQASRYVTLLIPAFLGGYFFLLTLDQRKLRRIFILVYFLVILPGHLPLQFDEKHPATYYSHWKQQWKDCYLETRDFYHCNRVVGKGVYPYESIEIQQKLNYLEEHQLNLFLDAD